MNCVFQARARRRRRALSACAVFIGPGLSLRESRDSIGVAPLWFMLQTSLPCARTPLRPASRLAPGEPTMRTIILAATAATLGLVAAPSALADTLTEVTSHGIVLEI